MGVTMVWKWWFMSTDEWDIRLRVTGIVIRLTWHHERHACMCSLVLLLVCVYEITSLFQSSVLEYKLLYTRSSIHWFFQFSPLYIACKQMLLGISYTWGLTAVTSNMYVFQHLYMITQWWRWLLQGCWVSLVHRGHFTSLGSVLTTAMHLPFPLVSEYSQFDLQSDAGSTFASLPFAPSDGYAPMT